MARCLASSHAEFSHPELEVKFVAKECSVERASRVGQREEHPERHKPGRMIF